MEILASETNSEEPKIDAGIFVLQLFKQGSHVILDFINIELY